MNKTRIFTITILIILFCSVNLLAQSEKTITGWSFGGVPAVAYNSDTGFLYGIVLELYNYGDGSYNPDYLYTTAPTSTRTTKGSGVNEIFFD